MIEKHEQTTERRKRLENTIKSAGLPKIQAEGRKGNCQITVIGMRTPGVGGCWRMD